MIRGWWGHSVPIVYEQAVIQGTVISRSLMFDKPRSRDFVGTLFGDVAGVWQQIILQASVTPGDWRTVAVQEWRVGSNPAVIWSGLARQVRLIADMKHPASVGMRIETT